VVLGIIAAFAAQAVVDVITNLIFPAPAFDMWDKKQVEAVLSARPAGALVLTALAYLIGAAVGGYVALAVARRSWALWVPVGLMELFAVVIAFAYPVPVWTKLAIVVAPILGGLLARHLAPKPLAAPHEGEAAGDAEA
jgi:hypothetical protein